MAEPLQWRDGEGYDIHVLRTGPTSPPLDQQLQLDPDGLTPFFVPHFKGAPSNFGVSVDTFSGEVTALAHPDPQLPKLRNFIMTVRQTLVGNTLETVIRVHVHDSITKIWLTPSALTLRRNPNRPTENQRFTVLAQFDDDTVGDISDWPELRFSTSNQFSVDVANVGDSVHGEPETRGGRLTAREAGDFPTDDPTITVELKLDSPLTDLNASAKVMPKPSWGDLAHDETATKVEWVAGKIRPNFKQTLDRPDSSERVVENGRNVLFIAEGYLGNQEKEFRKTVEVLVNNQLRKNPILEPFKLLANSMNYWSVFVESREEGVTVLGDHTVAGKPSKQVATDLPLPLPPTAPAWTIENMIHEAGLPLPKDPAVATEADWLTSRSQLYDIPSNVTLDPAALALWNDLRTRTLLNERDSAFGMAHRDRPRASGQGKSDENLLNDPRRTTPGGINEFVERLQLPDKLAIGARVWTEDAGPNKRLVCFVCQSAKLGGGAALSFFSASTGKAVAIPVKPAANGNGMDILTPPMKLNFSDPIVASVVAHGLGHALDLGDERGTLVQGVSPPARDIDHPNVEQEAGVTALGTSGPDRFLETDGIHWLWPRINGAAILDGAPTPQGNTLLVKVRPGQGTPFQAGDLVRIRQVPVEKKPSVDPFASIPLRVAQAAANEVAVEHVVSGGTQFDATDPALSDPAERFILIRTSISPGTELPLVADVIKNHMETSSRPLSGPAGTGPQGAGCVPGGNPTGAVTPINLPALSVVPPVKADIIGLYDGGGFRDCSVVRPAGWCKMRSGFDATTPFCHVCMYIIVDSIDPTKHPDLDLYYPDVQP